LQVDLDAEQRLDREEHARLQLGERDERTGEIADEPEERQQDARERWSTAKVEVTDYQPAEVPESPVGRPPRRSDTGGAGDHGDEM